MTEAYPAVLDNGVPHTVTVQHYTDIRLALN